MRDESIHLIQKTPYLFMAAAVSDYIPQYTQEGKLKKDILGEKWDLSLKKNIDILSNIDKNGICTIGFKAEMDASNANNNAKNMLNTKQLNAVCLNILKNSNSFGTDTNKIEFIDKETTLSLDENDKLSLSFDILHHSAKLLENNNE
jgi:phosphopantothenoylcysteine decarboxylase/phosphopantothenate--cysteine ligase